MTATLAESNKPFIVTSGVLGLPPGRPGTEDDTPSPHSPRKSEDAGLAAAKQGVRAMVARLSPSVHGDGDHGFVPTLIKTALDKGKAGASYHGVGDQGIPTRQIAEIIGRKLNVPVVSKTPEEAAAILGFIGMVFGMDCTASNALTQERLGWHPTGPGLIEDLEKGTYFT